MKPITVSQLNEYLRDAITSDPVLANVVVTGEISGLIYHNSGHVYFSIKDENALIECTLWSSVLPRIRYRLEDGMQITITGNVTLYHKNGRIKLNVRNIDVTGEGDLSVAFEKMKVKLEAEGLFEEASKKPLPFFPMMVAVLTAPDGAAINDIIRTITAKNDVCDIILVPVPVQGEGAAAEIASAIKNVNLMMPDVDIMIVGRGGGSLEDLWSFNEEVLARAIFASTIPIISAVGHENDNSISDLVADMRAATPTAAGEMAVPDTDELRATLDELESDLLKALSGYIKEAEQKLYARDPMRARQGLRERISRNEMSITNFHNNARMRINTLLESKKNDIALAYAKLEGTGPRAIMKRGYGIITDENGKMINSVNSLKKNARIKIIINDGSASATIEETWRDTDA